MEVTFDFSLWEMRNFLKARGYNIFGVDTWNSDYDLRLPDIPRIVKVECAIKSTENVRIDTSKGSWEIYNEYGLENQFIRELKLKLLTE